LAWAWGTYLGSEALQRGIKVTISNWRKFNSEAIPATAKACGQYLNSVLATRQATAAGFDEAILLDDAGHLAEGSGENLFLVRGGHVLTNDEHSSVLLGITRDSVIHLAKDLGIPVKIQQLELDDLFAADEAFLTGTAVEIAPISAVDGQRVGSGEPGTVTTTLQQAFFAAAYGENPQYLDWLTYASWIREDSANSPDKKDARS